MTAYGCKHAPVGASSFRIEDFKTTAQAVHARDLRIEKPTDVFVDAKPIGNLVNPAYPPQALANRVSAIISVRVAVNASGVATDEGRGLVDLSLPTPYDHEFRAAVDAALAQWRFQPAKIAHLLPRANQTPVIVGIDVIERTYAVVFTFSLSAGSSVTLK